MDAKDLRTESALGDRNDGNNYPQGSVALQCNRNKPYQDVGSNSLAKVDVPTARPCAVIGPDRVVPPPAAADVYLKKAPLEPWPGADIYRRPPEYPHKIGDYHHPTRNISPRQTFQENMQRIMVPPSYNVAKGKEDHNFPIDPNISPLRNTKLNMPSEAKYCDVPYTVNPIINEQKNVRSLDMSASNVNSALTRSVPQGWAPGSTNNIRPSKPYAVPEMFQYPEYSSCAGGRPMLMPRPHRTIHGEPGHAYADPYYHEGNLRFKPYPVKERMPQSRYEYLNNYSNTFHPTPFPTPKYDLQKSTPQSYPTYSQVPQYFETRMAEQAMNGYQRPLNQPANFNTVPFRNQMIHPTYGPVPGNCVQPNKFYPYPTDNNSVKTTISNKSTYDGNSKIYASEFENTRAKTYHLPESFYVNEMTRPHPLKSHVFQPNYPTVNMQHTMPPHPYYRKENSFMKTYEYGPQFRNIDPSSINMSGNPLSRLPSQFSPIAISPDSNTSNDTIQTQGTSQEDCGYISQSSSVSTRSAESGINRIPNDLYRRYDYRYGPSNNTPFLYKPQSNHSNNMETKPNKKGIDVRQFLQMWNEGEDENGVNNKKDFAVKATSTNDNKHYETNNQEQLYVLGLVNVPREELGKYEHIQKVSKLPENIKGYNGIELLTQFEEVIESSNLNNYNVKVPKPRDFHVPLKGSPSSFHEIRIPSRPISPLDVEAKISQSVIHKEVGCNFEIKPCSPKMLNVGVASPAQSVLAERAIAKVTNSTISSPISISQSMDENMDNCNIMKRQDSRISSNENTKAPSCKMVNTPNDAIDSDKTNYSMQDLESNSGVCFASLPRLDHDIELNFPEVNQQFINANKVESVIISTPKDLPALDVNPSETNENEDINEYKITKVSANIEHEKESSKLSRYRKLKRKLPEKNSDQNAQAMRINSVIIKNPENNKGFEENVEQTSPKKKIAHDIQQNPINLTVHTEEQLNTVEMDSFSNNTVGDKTETAIDFSLNFISVAGTTHTKFEHVDDSKDSHSDTTHLEYATKDVTNNPRVLNSHGVNKHTSNYKSKDTTECINEKNSSMEFSNNSSLESITSDIRNTNTDSDSGLSREIQSFNYLPENNSPTHETNLLIRTKLECTSNLTKNIVKSHNNNTMHLFNDLTTTEQEMSNNSKGLTSCIDKCADNNVSQTKCDATVSVQEVNPKLTNNTNDTTLNSVNIIIGTATPNVSLFHGTKHMPETDIIENQNTESSKLYREEKECNNFNSESINVVFTKELYSPWIQKLILFSEGFCPSLQNKSQVKTVDTIKCNPGMLQSDNSIDSTNSCVGKMTSDACIKNRTVPNVDEITVVKGFDESVSNKLKNESFVTTLNNSPISCESNAFSNFKPISDDINAIITEPKTSKLEIITEGTPEINKSDYVRCIDPIGELISENSNINGVYEKITSSNVDCPIIENDEIHELIDDTKICTNIYETTCVESNSKPTIVDSSIQGEVLDNPSNKYVQQILELRSYIEDTAVDIIKKDVQTNVDETVLYNTSTSKGTTNKFVSEKSESHSYIQDTVVDAVERNPKNIMENTDPSGTVIKQNDDEVFDVTAGVTDPCHRSISKTNLVITSDTDKTVSDPPGSHYFISNSELDIMERKVVSAITENNTYFDRMVYDALPMTTDSDSCLKDMLTTVSTISESSGNVRCDFGTVDNDAINTITNLETAKTVSNIAETVIEHSSLITGAEKEEPYVNYVSVDSHSEDTTVQPLTKMPETNKGLSDSIYESDTSVEDITKCDPNLETVNDNLSCSYAKKISVVGESVSPEVNTSINKKSSSPMSKTTILNPCLNYGPINIIARNSDNYNSAAGDIITEPILDTIDIVASFNDESNSLDVDAVVDVTISDEAILNTTETNNTHVDVSIADVIRNPIDKIIESKTDIGGTSVILQTIETDVYVSEIKNVNVTDTGVDKSAEFGITDNMSKVTISELIKPEPSIHDVDGYVYKVKTDTTIQDFKLDLDDTRTDEIATKNSKTISHIDIITERSMKNDSSEENSTHTYVLTVTEAKHTPSSNSADNYASMGPEVKRCRVNSLNNSAFDNEIDTEQNPDKLNVQNTNVTALEIPENQLENFTNNPNNDLNKVHDLTDELADTVFDGGNLNHGEIFTCDFVSHNKPRIPDAYKHSTSNFASTKKPVSLKRSLSDSALDRVCAIDCNENRGDSINEPLLWPNKRKKNAAPENITHSQFITEGYCNIIHHSNRRNSVSTVYNEENVSFCILIDDNCVLTEEDDETEKICFTEIPGDCISCIPTEGMNVDENADLSTEIMQLQDEINCEYPGSFIFDPVEDEDKPLDESWVEDVACVETVISDDIAEDVIVSASSSPKDSDVSDNESNNNEINIFDVNQHSDKVKYIYGGKMCSNDAELVETLYRTPQMDVNKTLVWRDSQETDDCSKYYDIKSLEDVLSESNIYKDETFTLNESPLNTSSAAYSERKENVKFHCFNNSPLANESKIVNNINVLQKECEITDEVCSNPQTLKPLHDTVHSSESSVDDVFSYNQTEKEQSPKCIISSSPEVSSTTPEERNTSILLKITNYGGSRTARVNDVNTGTKRNTVSCKYTENKDYIKCNSNVSVRPLITKAAQKYIPPLKETVRDLKIKLPLPQHSLVKLKELKVSKEEPKLNKNKNKLNFVNNCKAEIVKKPKPKFEDILKSIDDIQLKMHKDKAKKIKNIPKVVIKKSENGSHYASTSNKDKFNPDLTGRKWQPWVFIERNSFIDKMALRNKTTAIFSHRKNSYVLAEGFKKYKSISIKDHHQSFVMSQPRSNNSKGQLKYTIRLKHNY